MKPKEKSQVERLSVLPLPLIEQDLTRVIPCYQHGLLQSKLRDRKVMNNTHESKDNFLNQVFTAKDELEKNHNWTFIGLASFEDNLDLKLAQHWIQLEQETFESVNITPLPPSFRPHMPYLSCKTDNTSRPLCVVRGKWNEFISYQVSEKLLDTNTRTMGFSYSYSNWPKSASAFPGHHSHMFRPTNTLLHIVILQEPVIKSNKHKISPFKIQKEIFPCDNIV